MSIIYCFFCATTLLSLCYSSMGLNIRVRLISNRNASIYMIKLKTDGFICIKKLYILKTPNGVFVHMH
ncbi:hypothetical protein L1887_10626 [Cichorium endivia]|nr:hypothetical protein L1887_10626 [Cichorium endivia]